MRLTVRLTSGFRQRFEGGFAVSSYADSAKAWDRDVAGVVVPTTSDNSLDVVTALLEKQLDRAMAAIKTNDDKAALAIPSVGVLAGIVGSNVRSDIGSHQGLAALGAAAALAAVIAICLAIVALRPQSLSNGPLALLAVRGVSEPSDAGKLNYLKALGFAVQSAEDLVLVKALWVNWAFRVGAVGVVLLTVFVALGGFAPNGGSGQ